MKQFQKYPLVSGLIVPLALLCFCLLDYRSTPPSVEYFENPQTPWFFTDWVYLSVATTLLLLFLLTFIVKNAKCSTFVSLWQKWDPLLATLILFCVLFDPWPVRIYSVFTLIFVSWSIHLLRRVFIQPKETHFIIIFSILVFLLLFPTLVQITAYRMAARFYDLSTVDHRPHPGGEINSDGIRFLGESTDISEDEFVVLFLGDSFTYGIGQAYSEAYPYKLEQILQSSCPKLRVVNFGWPSASPLLNLRLLKRIGKKYQPDLVVYTVDLTDYTDDLVYQASLNLGKKGPKASGGAVIPVLTNLPEPIKSVLFEFLHWFYHSVRKPRYVIKHKITSGLEFDRKYFVATQPLEWSRNWIEKGVVENLLHLNEYSTSELEIPFAAAIFPRASQYSETESLRSWEEFRFLRKGRYALEVFQYFEQEKMNFPFKIANLLEDFRSYKGQPLFFEEDSHWNSRGNHFMAQKMAEFLKKSNLIDPCLGSSG